MVSMVYIFVDILNRTRWLICSCSVWCWIGVHFRCTHQCWYSTLFCTGLGRKLTVYLGADLTVMLALVAGRNGGETMSIFNNSEVHTHIISTQLSCCWIHDSGQTMVTIYVLRSSAKHNISIFILYNGFHMRRSHRTCNSRTSDAIRDNRLRCCNPASPPQTQLGGELKSKQDSQPLRRVDLGELSPRRVLSSFGRWPNPWRPRWTNVTGQELQQTQSVQVSLRWWAQMRKGSCWSYCPRLTEGIGVTTVDEYAKLMNSAQVRLQVL